jgi:hypothetical protein
VKSNVKPIQCTLQDPIQVERFTKITRLRRYPRPSRTVRELALERAKQIEDYGDVPMVPAPRSARSLDLATHPI